ncbi:alpha/beta fold hydrolase [Marinobacter sp. CHS3-4]|uniref:alpha/beta fold hydrolase n=1 Tax=Marinobacter sp. CHS3-4 TaxID=3045174 RepID=UPI0024B5631A|nr:alpha/beta fold hydrolase [Marinobacter sp. CHS3-4]MDI9245715.1 alpha/beta fold hydrolase [Marinobacter sp. CHS3-4]
MCTLILAHGAGAPADSYFMEYLADALAREGIATVRFEFPYMERRREDGKKRPPDRQPVLLAHFRELIRQVSDQQSGSVYIGGKSMGGRMASLLAAEPAEQLPVQGCVCFGYPFHPPGKHDRWRLDHFKDFQCPVMVIQGTRDPFGKKDETDWAEKLEGSRCRLYWLEGGNHDFKPLAKQPETQEQLLEEAARMAASFIREAG